MSARGETWGVRLGEVEKALISAEERSLGLSERLGAVEAMGATGLESLLVRHGGCYRCCCLLLCCTLLWSAPLVHGVVCPTGLHACGARKEADYYTSQ